MTGIVCDGQILSWGAEMLLGSSTGLDHSSYLRQMAFSEAFASYIPAMPCIDYFLSTNHSKLSRFHSLRSETGYILYSLYLAQKDMNPRKVKQWSNGMNNWKPRPQVPHLKRHESEKNSEFDLVRAFGGLGHDGSKMVLSKSSHAFLPALF